MFGPQNLHILSNVYKTSKGDKARTASFLNDFKNESRNTLIRDKSLKTDVF